MTHLRLMRYARGLAIAAVTRETGIDASYLSKVERGKAAISPATAKALAEFYEVDIAEVLGVATPAEAA